MPRLDAASRRAVASRRGSDHPWYRERLAVASLDELREAAASLQHNRGMMFGMFYSGPPIPDRVALLAETFARIEALAESE